MHHIKFGYEIKFACANMSCDAVGFLIECPITFSSLVAPVATRRGLLTTCIK